MQLDPATDVVARLADPAAAQRLLDDPRARRMTRAGGSFHYADPVTRKLVSLRGLTRVLQALYWPDEPELGRGRKRPVDATSADVLYPLPKKRRTKGTKGKKAPPLHDPAPPAVDPMSPLALATGSVRGSMVHEQLHDALTLDAGSFARRHPAGWHPWTKPLLAALLGRPWWPLASEYMVCEDQQRRLGTALDLVCATPAGKLVFVELKTSSGRAHFFEHHGGGTTTIPWMSGAFAGLLRNTPANRALVQLMASVLLAVHGLGLRDDFEAWVAHTDGTHVDLVQLEPAFLLQHGPRVWADLLEAK